MGWVARGLGGQAGAHPTYAARVLEAGKWNRRFKAYKKQITIRLK